MNIPSWITAPNLGQFSQDYSFDLNPINLLFSAGTSNTVSLINGSLPRGLKWEKINQTIKITGVAVADPTSINSRFTFRIIQSNGSLADRTFFLKLNAVPVAPSWANQATFLGFQGNSNIQSYQLVATAPAGQHISYSLGIAPSGMTIGSNTGLLTFDANAITTNTTVNFNVTASTLSASNDIDLSLDVVISPLAPKWYTTSGSLGVFAGDDFFEENLLAEDVTGAAVTYAITASSSGFPLSLDDDGLLYGRFLNPLSETTFTFTVSATSINGTSSRNFSVSVVPNEQISLLSWITPSDLGSINEGEIVEVTVEAITRRNVPLIYNVTGSLLPPHLMVDSARGLLIGYCEYTAVPKQYNFDITATDGYQSVTRQFTLTVNKVYGNQFFGATIPLTGDLRLASLADVGNVRVREGGTKKFSVVNDTYDPPTMNIINGLVTGYETPDAIVENASPWLHTLSTQLGQVAASANVDISNSILYREIVDYQAGSNVTVYSQAVYNTNVSTNGIVYPISIENMRINFASNHNYVNGGSGSGAVLSPNLNWDTGAIESIRIISTGTGYLNAPKVIVSGSGEGAKVRAILGTRQVSIASPGQGWAVGDIITIPGIYNTPATLTVETVGTNGSLATVSVSSPGDYEQVIALPSVYVQNEDAYAYISPTWGVINAEVINGGVNYQCGCSVSAAGNEILPKWQMMYFPMMELGKISTNAATEAASVMNNEPNALWGSLWDPNYLVMQWQGLKWLGQTTFEDNFTTFDGDSTRFHEVEDVKITVFDNDLTVFNQGLTEFDARNPVAYDLQQVWGSTLVDSGTTVFDLYTTIFDALPPRKKSNTLLQKWIKLNNKVYSGNNFVV